MTRIDLKRRIAHFIGARRPGRRVRGCLFAGLASSLVTSLAAAADPSRDVPAQCFVPEEIAIVDGPLVRLARRLKSSEPLTVVVVGAGSAAGSGTSRKEAAFPYRLQTRLESAYPKSTIKLVLLARTGQTVPAMRARIAEEVVPLRPALVIWQTGAADAARGISINDFDAALEQGITDLKEAGSDVLLVDGQFGPRASLLVNTDAYRESMRWSARRFDVPLFKRYDTMQYWWSNEVFDLDAQDKVSQVENADRIHDCVAALILKVIQRGVSGRAAS